MDFMCKQCIYIGYTGQYVIPIHVIALPRSDLTYINNNLHLSLYLLSIVFCSPLVSLFLGELPPICSNSLLFCLIKLSSFHYICRPHRDSECLLTTTNGNFFQQIYWAKIYGVFPFHSTMSDKTKKSLGIAWMRATVVWHWTTEGNN